MVSLYRRILGFQGCDIYNLFSNSQENSNIERKMKQIWQTISILGFTTYSFHFSMGLDVFKKKKLEELECQ
jgi:hypothetical protein